MLEVLKHDGEKSAITMVDPPHGVSPWQPAEMEGVRYTRNFVSSPYGKPYSTRNEEEAGWDRDFANIMYR